MSQLGEGFRRKEDREERGVRVVSSFLPLTSLFLWRQKRQSKVTTHSPVSVLSHSVAEVDSESCAPVSSLRLGNSLFLEEEEEEKEVEFFFSRRTSFFSKQSNLLFTFSLSFFSRRFHSCNQNNVPRQLPLSPGVDGEERRAEEHGDEEEAGQKRRRPLISQRGIHRSKILASSRAVSKRLKRRDEAGGMSSTLTSCPRKHGKERSKATSKAVFREKAFCRTLGLSTAVRGGERDEKRKKIERTSPMIDLELSSQILEKREFFCLLLLSSETHFAGAPSALSPHRVACDTLLPSPVEARGQESSFFSSCRSSSVVVGRCRSRRRRHREEEEDGLSAAASDGVGRARRIPSEPRQGLGKPLGHGAQQVRGRVDERRGGGEEEGLFFRRVDGIRFPPSISISRPLQILAFSLCARLVVTRL